jgi:hypothetical protein
MPPLLELGAAIRVARLRRRQPAADFASRLGVTLPTLRKLRRWHDRARRPLPRPDGRTDAKLAGGFPRAPGSRCDHRPAGKGLRSGCRERGGMNAVSVQSELERLRLLDARLRGHDESGGGAGFKPAPTGGTSPALFAAVSLRFDGRLASVPIASGSLAVATGACDEMVVKRPVAAEPEPGWLTFVFLGIQKPVVEVRQSEAFARWFARLTTQQRDITMARELARNL